MSEARRNGRLISTLHCERNYVCLPSQLSVQAHPGKLAVLRQYGTLHTQLNDRDGTITVQWIPHQDSAEEGFVPLTCRANTYHRAVSRIHASVARKWHQLAESARNINSHREGSDDKW